MTLLPGGPGPARIARSAVSRNRPIGLLKLVVAAGTLSRVERENIAGLRLALAAGFIALCVFAVALLGAVA